MVGSACAQWKIYFLYIVHFDICTAFVLNVFFGGSGRRKLQEGVVSPILTLDLGDRSHWFRVRSSAYTTTVIWPIELCLDRRWRLFQLFLFENECSLLLQSMTESHGNILSMTASHLSRSFRSGLYERFYCLPTRGQSNLTKSASRGAHSPVRGHPQGVESCTIEFLE